VTNDFIAYAEQAGADDAAGRRTKWDQMLEGKHPAFFSDVPILRRELELIRDAGADIAQIDDPHLCLFVDPDDEPIRWAASAGAQRVELYTEPFARAFEQGEGAGRASFEAYADAARLAASLGLGVNAGHDLNLENLRLFRGLPHLAEVSIGHALISHALVVGLDRSVRDYLQVLADPVRSLSHP
jgi:pyridoxine 5'-phosphate synthase PdxJ